MKYTLIFLFIINSFIAFSQVEVYRTFQDFENDNTEKFDDLNIFKFDYPEKMVDTYKFYKNRTSIKTKEIWGFKYKNVLFRIDHDYPKHPAVRMIAKNKLVYYENGYAHLNMLRDDSEAGTQLNEYAAYISLNLNSALVPIGEGWWAPGAKKRKKIIKGFRREYPQFDAFFDCLRNFRIETVRRCISEFEGYEIKQ